MEEPAVNGCFGCGPENPAGLRLAFVIETSGAGEITSAATARISRNHEGAAGFVHGGIIATLMDEAMSKLAKPLGLRAVTRHLEVEYLRPVPIETPLMLIGVHARREGRKLYHRAELRDAEGTVLARGEGLFIVIAGRVL